MSSARQAAERYLEHVNAGALDALVALFADDAVLLHPAGTFTGHEAIGSFYAESVLAFSPTIAATSWISDGRACVFEMEAGAPGADTRVHAIDHLTVDEAGHIIRLAIYYR